MQPASRTHDIASRRKRIGSTVAIGVMILLAGSIRPASAQDLRIAYVRSATILDQYQGARVATEQLNRDVQEWNTEAQTRRRELDVIGKQLEAQAPMLSDAVRRQKEQDYQTKLNEYDNFVQSIWGPGGLVAQRNEELLRVVVEKVQAVARRIADEDGYDFVFDASDGNIIYADPEHDLTNRVLETLNQPE